MSKSDCRGITSNLPRTVSYSILEYWSQYHLEVWRCGGEGNPYIKPIAVNCYRCLEPEHKSNECPNRRLANFVDYEGDEDMINDNKLQDVGYAEEEDCVSCVIRKLMYTTKVQHTS